MRAALDAAVGGGWSTTPGGLTASDEPGETRRRTVWLLAALAALAALGAAAAYWLG